MNVEMAYLVGMILGNGEIQRGTTKTTITIDIPYKNLYTDDMKDVAIYVKASILDISRIIEPMLSYKLIVTETKHSTKVSFSKDNDEYVIREIVRLIGAGRHHSTMRMNPELFGITTDQKKALLRGIADVTGYIRKSNVASGEAGGITQEIGAYQVECNGKKITFIDTPGHAAFTEMRARGASVTDIVIIIVAADDGVMPQTKEAIDHAKAAKVPIIVCINKIDKPDADIERVMTGLVESGLTPEEWGGDTLVNRISAKTGEGVDALLENILLVAEMEELKANPNRYATGAVLESKMDKHVGAVATLLIQNGTLRLGDPIVVGTAFGKVRTLKNDLGEDITSAPPSMPVEVTGLSLVPSAGDKFMAFETEKQAKQIASDRALREREVDTNRTGMSLEELFGQINEGLKEINVVLKTDTNGSLEAVKSSLEKIDVEGVKINVIRGAVGGITESDVVLAQASNAIIIGFNVRGSNKVVDIAKEYNVEIRLYDIIYKVVEDMEKAMKGMLEPIYEEKVTGTVEVRQLFKFSKVGMIAGCHVTSGIIKNNDKARVVRDGIVIYNGSIKSLQHEKDTVKEMSKDHDCGLTLENFQDYKEGDTIEVYELIEIER